MNFTAVWQKVQNSLNAGDSIKNWTVAKKYLGDNFRIVSVSNELIKIESPKAENAQTVAKEDFEILFHMWPAYLEGSVRRHEMRDKSRYSKYTISIFHHANI